MIHSLVLTIMLALHSPKEDLYVAKLPEIHVISHFTEKDLKAYLIKQETYHVKCIKDNTQYSNGYGTKARYVGEVISKEQSLLRMRSHYQKDLKRIRSRYPHLSFSHKNILTAVFYNIGSAGPALDSALRDYDNRAIKIALLKYTKSNGIHLEVLQQRREKDVKLWAIYQ